MPTNVTPAAGQAADRASEQPSLARIFGTLQTLFARKGGSVFADLNHVLRIAGLVGFFLLVFTLFYSSAVGTASPKLVNLCFIAASGFACGALVGFILGAFGDEKQAFGSISTTINGIIGGFALGDLGKNESVIKKMFHSLAAAAGTEEVGFVASVVSYFAVLGFVCMYVNKQYLLNPAASRIQQLETQNDRLTAAIRGLDLFRDELDSKNALTAEEQQRLKATLAQVKTLLKEGELFRQMSPEKLKTYARAHIALEDWAEAEDVLRRARYTAPDDPDLLFHFAHVLLKLGRYEEAARYLSFLIQFPSARVMVYKYLGFACLFVPGRLEDSERATLKYLAFDPEDVGAKINLACVYGQRGPKEQKVRDKVFDLLRQAVESKPESVSLIQSLTGPGQDFEKWKDLPDFKAIVGNSAPVAPVPGTGMAGNMERLLKMIEGLSDAQSLELEAHPPIIDKAIEDEVHKRDPQNRRQADPAIARETLKMRLTIAAVKPENLSEWERALSK